MYKVVAENLLLVPYKFRNNYLQPKHEDSRTSWLETRPVVEGTTHFMHIGEAIDICQCNFLRYLNVIGELVK